MKKHISNTEKISLMVLPIVLVGLFLAIYYSSNFIATSAYKYISNTVTSKNAALIQPVVSNGNTNSDTIALQAVELKNLTYRWQNADEINPTLHLVSNKDYTIQINNPTDTKHQLIITSSGKEIATSKEAQPGKNTEFTFNTDLTGNLQYHCEYHPDTMKGTIKVVNQNTG
jgi:hypothetical protein